MGVSALRVAASAGVLVGVLIFGTCTAGLALADPGGGGHHHRGGQSSKDVDNERSGWGHSILQNLGERRRRHHAVAQDAPPTTFGSGRESAVAATESTVMDAVGDTTEPAPELVPDPDRDADPAGNEIGTEATDPGGNPEPETGGVDLGPPPDAGGGGSDYSVAVDNTDASVTPEPVAATSDEPAAVGYPYQFPFPFYLLEIRRDGGTWWNANQIIARIGDALNPAPEPAPAPAPAFRTESIEPEPVIDATGGVAGGGGSDYQPLGFGAAPVLRAPVIAVPVLPTAAVRFGAAPAAEPAGPGTGLARGGGNEVVTLASGIRPDGTQGSPPAGTVTSMAGQVPRQSFTEYLRKPGLPQVVGAALPGLAGILLMTYSGGVIGYRQARAGWMVRTTAAARFLP
jgi:hypothetical protein